VFCGDFYLYSQVKAALSGARGHVDNALKALSTVQIKSTQSPQGWSLWHVDIRTGGDRHVPLFLGLSLYLPFFPQIHLRSKFTGCPFRGQKQ